MFNAVNQQEEGLLDSNLSFEATIFNFEGLAMEQRPSSEWITAP